MISLDDLATVHSEGRTFAKYYEKDSSILTAGQDGDIRLYPAIHEDEKFTITTGTTILSLALFGDKAVVGTSNNDVRIYDLNDVPNYDTLLEFTAAISHVCVKKDGSQIAGGSCDFNIKIVDIDGTNQKTLEGHEAPVTCLVFYGDKLLSSSCDGTIRMWNISNQTLKSSLKVLPSSNSFQDLSVMSLSEVDSLLAVPAGKICKIIRVSEKLEAIHDLPEEHTEIITVCCWSNENKQLATASKNGELFIWKNLQCIHRFKHHENKEICSLQWNALKKNEILFTDVDGQFGFCTLIKQAEPAGDDRMKEVGESNVHDSENDDMEEDIDVSFKKTKRKHNEIKDFDDDDEDSNDGLSAKKHRINNMENFLDDAADEDDDIDETINDNNISLNLIKEGLLGTINKQPVINEDDEDSVSNFDANKKVEKNQRVDIKVHHQPPFQPTATPAHLTHRFMVWNSVGIVFFHSQDGISSINVEFHDANTHHSLNFPNVFNNTMAALSNTMLALACRKDGDSHSKLTCHHFASWDSNKEWAFPFSKDEEILALACNSNFISCATSQQYLRIFSVSGIQSHVSYLPGKIVTLVMCPKKLMVVCHQGSGLNNQQSFVIQHYNYRHGVWKIACSEMFHMRHESTLVWAGYSREGTPALVDSIGTVLLKNLQSNSWFPISHLKSEVKNKSDNYWVIGIEEQTKQIRCIYCKASKCPSTLPRPVPTSVPFKLPLLEATQEKSKLEHEYLVTSLVKSNVKEQHPPTQEIDYEELEKKNTELLIRMFALACKADRDFKAVEICRLMTNVETISFAIQYASKQRKFELARRLDQLAKDRMADNEKLDDDEDDDILEDDIDDNEDIDMNDSDFELDVEESSKKEPVSNSRKLSINANKQSKAVSMPLSKKTLNRPSLEGKNIDSQETTSQPSTNNGHVVNPFKMTNRKSTDARGTTYFDNMSKENLKSKSANKTKMATPSVKATGPKQIKLNSKKMTVPSKKAQSNGETKENTQKKTETAKKVTGFQLFLDHLKESLSSEERESEDFAMDCTSKWKQLSKDEKQEWNNKAKQGTSSKPVPQKQVNVSSKSKLNAFAFSK